MGEHMEILWWLLAGAGVVVVVIVGISVLSVYMLPKATFEPLGPMDEAEYELRSRTGLGSDFLDDNGFEWVGVLRMHSVLGKTLICAWQQIGSPTYAVFYILPNNKTSVDIVSIFSIDPDFGLTTGTSKDGHFIPHRPGSYMQTFSTKDVATLWQHHTEAEALLSRLDLVKLYETDLPLSELLKVSIQHQMAHVRSIPLWPLLMVWRYFVTRYRLHNKTIAQQLKVDA